MKNQLHEQAEELARCLPAVMRRLFTLDEDPPAAEMPLAQLRALGALGAAPKTVSALSEELGTSVSAATQVADRMERAGLVERVLGADDRRVRLVRLTPAGLRLLRTRHERRVRSVQAVLETMSPEARREVLRALATLLQACQPTGAEAARPWNLPLLTHVDH